MCNLVNFVDEIAFIQRRGVHGSGKSHWNVISMGIPWEWE